MRKRLHLSILNDNAHARLDFKALHGALDSRFNLGSSIMVYTDRSIHFTAAEMAHYRAIGIDVVRIKTYREFAQVIHGKTQPVAVPHTKEKQTMAKRFGRHALNGTMEYFDTYEELLAAQRRDIARIHNVCFGVIGLLAGGLLAYALLQRLSIDAKFVRFVGVVFGIWLGGILGAGLSALWWRIVKWALAVSAILLVGLFIWLII
ncbi:MAG TPA: hypothetical protein VIF82_12895 [Burkholderiaceae bacterium]